MLGLMVGFLLGGMAFTETGRSIGNQVSAYLTDAAKSLKDGGKKDESNHNAE